MQPKDLRSRIIHSDFCIPIFNRDERRKERKASITNTSRLWFFAKWLHTLPKNCYNVEQYTNVWNGNLKIATVRYLSRWSPNSSLQWNYHNRNIIMVFPSISLRNIKQFIKIHSCNNQREAIINIIMYNTDIILPELGKSKAN